MGAFYIRSEYYSSVSSLDSVSSVAPSDAPSVSTFVSSSDMVLLLIVNHLL